MKRSRIGMCLSAGVVLLALGFVAVTTVGFSDTAQELAGWRGRDRVIAYERGNGAQSAVAGDAGVDGDERMGYAEPLGESVTTRANKGRMLETLAIAQMTALVGVGALAVVAALVGLRCWKNSQKG